LAFESNRLDLLSLYPQYQLPFSKGQIMKAVTEFPSYTLTKAVTTKAALTAEGKTPEEIQASLGESFKLEGDKLKHFVAAVDVASQNPQNLRRVLVVSLAEGEKVPMKSVQVEEHYYVPEFLITSAPKPVEDNKGRRGGPGGKGKGGGGPKSSPWGLSPEEKAAKNKGGAKTAKPT
jgi:hypothetical protein